MSAAGSQRMLRLGVQEVHDAAFASTDLVHGLRRSSRSGFSGHDCGGCITAYGVANALQRGVRRFSDEPQVVRLVLTTAFLTVGVWVGGSPPDVGGASPDA